MSATFYWIVTIFYFFFFGHPQIFVIIWRCLCTNEAFSLLLQAVTCSVAVVKAAIVVTAAAVVVGVTCTIFVSFINNHSTLYLVSRSPGLWVRVRVRVWAWARVRVIHFEMITWPCFVDGQDRYEAILITAIVAVCSCSNVAVDWQTVLSLTPVVIWEEKNPLDLHIIVINNWQGSDYSEFILLRAKRVGR